MTAPRAGQVDAMVSRWTNARGKLVRTAVGLLVPQWAGVDPYDHEAVAAFAEQAAGTAQSAQDRSGQLMEAYLRNVLALVEAPPPPHALASTGAPSRVGIDPVEVYQRPAETVRYQRSRDVDPAEAAARGRRRLEQLVETDVQLGARDAARAVLASTDRVTGWRRVLRPEMSRDGPCGLCMVASDRVYKRGDLMDLHDGCCCVPLPITRAHDPGSDLNAEDFDRIYSATGGRTDRGALHRVRIATREHGELGPRLVDAEHHFRGPDEAAA